MREQIEINGMIIEIMHSETGATVDKQGYVQPTYNWTTVAGWEQDPESGEHTGRAVVAARNGGDVSEVHVLPAETEPTAEALREWLLDWDDEYLADMESEGVVPRG